MRYSFIVPGRAVPAQRMTRKSKWTKRSKKSLEYQESVAWEAKAAKIPVLEGPVQLTARFYFRNKVHGDLSNCIKAVEDGLQYGGIVKNDKQIIRYGETTGIYYADGDERAEIEIETIGEGDADVRGQDKH